MTERKFAKVTDGIDDVKYIRPSILKKEGKTGIILEGTFLEAIPNSKNPKKDDFKFELEDGEIVIINGAGNLGFQMNRVDVNEFVQIHYLGTQKMTKGPYKDVDVHNFEVMKEV